MKCFYDISNIKSDDIFEYPEAFARFYDLIYEKIDTDLSKDVYLNEIRKTKGTILDAGAGTGSIFIEVFKEGADIYGLDVSKNMLDVLRKKLPGEHQNRILLKDIRKMNLGMEFDLIIAPFRVFQHILKTDEQINTLNNIYHHLKPGGKFIFDVFIPDLNILLNEINDFTDFEFEYEKGEFIKRSFSSKCDLINQINNVEMKIQWTEKGKTNIEVWNVPMRYFFRYELENLIKCSDLDLIDIYGDCIGKSLTNNSKNFIVVSQRGLY
ncbi:MAG: class I SAM-dependent methyltransferase [Ignavibacteria bacterium]|nr:class I SAM-dependent methyltransferase [Ignavibacteria bacterium]